MTSHQPAAIPLMQRRAASLGFTMSSTDDIGPLLAVLAAARPGGRILELGTGVGVGTAWLLSGMADDAHLTTIELDDSLSSVARELIDDARAEFVVGDGEAELTRLVKAGATFDLIFADTWPGKFYARDLALTCLAPGGTYVIDDLDPADDWEPGRADDVAALVADIESRVELTTVRIPWASGVLLATRRA